MCCKSCCARGPQGKKGIDGAINVLFQENIETSSAISDSPDESFLISNSNRLEYISTELARYRVSFQAKINSLSGTELVHISPYKGVGSQAYPNLGSQVVYLGEVTESITSNTYIVYEFDIKLAVGESIGITLGDDAGASNLTLLDNIFIVDKISL